MLAGRLVPCVFVFSSTFVMVEAQCDLVSPCFLLVTIMLSRTLQLLELQTRFLYSLRRDLWNKVISFGEAVRPMGV